MMWIKKDYTGNKQVWYSENTIKRMQASFNPPIEEIANVAGKALQESEDNNEQSSCELLCIKLQELKAEYERLKKEIDTWKYQTEKRDEIGDVWYDIAQKYKTCLQEIKEIAEICMNKDGCYECKYCDDCYIEDAEFPTYDICKLLIQKINKTEEE